MRARQDKTGSFIQFLLNVQVGDEEEAAKPKYNSVNEMDEDFEQGLAATAIAIGILLPQKVSTSVW